MASWVLHNNEEKSILVNVDASLRSMLTVGINIYSWGRAQMDNQNSLLRALTRTPGVFYFADGNTLGAVGHGALRHGHCWIFHRPWCEVVADTTSTLSYRLHHGHHLAHAEPLPTT